MSSLALTFDDGPDPDGTPRVLDALAQARASATFFVIAPRAAAHPELIRRMLAEGHTVGLHCDQHVRHSDRDRAWVRADTERALGRLARLGVTPSLWRTPWGDTASWTGAIAERHELRLVAWSIDTYDWRGDSAEAMFAATSEQLRADAIVLAHDGIGPGALRENAGETVAYVKLVAGHARRRRLSLAALA